MKMGHFQDSEVHSTSRAKPIPWVAHTGELLVSYLAWTRHNRSNTSVLAIGFAYTQRVKQTKSKSGDSLKKLSKV